METKVLAAVRVRKTDSPDCRSTVQTVQYGVENQGNVLAAVQVENKTVEVSFAFGSDCRQEQVYIQMLAPFMPSFLEGFDVSIVTYGQKNTGKSFSVYGNGVGCLANETDYGLCQRFVRDLFQSLTKRPERTCRVSISWAEISNEDEQFVDLFNNLGLVHCFSLKDCFDWIDVGFNARNPDNHNIFTLILEQQWVTDNGYNQHKLSTLSFCDLCGTERQAIISDENEELSLPRSFSLQALEHFILKSVDPSHAPEQSGLYGKSSLPTLLKDSFGGRAQTVLMLCVSPLAEDTSETLANLEFAKKVQNVRNFVFMNAFTDNNVPIESLYNHNSEVDFRNNNENVSSSQRFAMQQWLKLLQNAEGLFNKIILTQNIEGLQPDEIHQIEEWLYLKAECDECINLNEIDVDPNPIQERCLGPIEEMDENEEEENTQDSSDSDSEICHKITDIDVAVDSLLSKFESETDAVVEKSYRDYLRSHPQTLDSHGSLKLENGYSRERRKSIQPGSEISLSDLAKLESSLNQSTEIPKIKSSGVETKLQKCQTEISALECQITELSKIIKVKEKTLHEIEKSSSTRKTAKRRFMKQKNSLQAEYDKASSKLARAVASSKDKSEIERLKNVTTKIQQNLSDLIKVQNIAEASNEESERTQKSLHASKTKLAGLQAALKKEKKLKGVLEKELECERKGAKGGSFLSISDGKNKIRDMNTKIMLKDIKLREKTEHLEADSENALSLRHEIRQLRHTKNHLSDEIERLRRGKFPSHTDERRLYEYEEAIEAIDTAIELKNERICGRRSVDTDESLQREKGEQLLVSRLNRLSTEEMRTLLYKYYMKVIDLKSSSKTLEIQLYEMDRQKDAWEYREHKLRTALQQTRAEAEKKIALIQRQQQLDINNMLKHFANSGSASSSYTSSVVADESMMGGKLELYNPRHLVEASSTDFSMDLLRMHAALKATKPTEVVGFGNKYKPLEKVRMMLRVGNRENEKKKLQVQNVIPQQNLKQLATSSTSATLPGATKVTKLKNKLIIQQQDNH